jgi:N-acetylmuramoyl-L-alanine amidase
VAKPDTLMVQKPKTERTWVDSPMAEIPKASTQNDQIIFRVQIISSPTKIDLTPPQFKGLSNVYEYLDQDNRYKYTVGESNHPDELIYLQNSLRQKGFKDAFIIAMQSNKRISMKDALQKIKK